ncbi:PorT family protein [Bizionia gelidisalsuginis]|uniref:PorT family protein n=1 Tax=Bizionia gelidisalsuginis TaxID=291188 RepID=A0ABY3MCP6_9FLAO|nr:outer membrane beta-barrel protein [Bizionia gelidisalsuginis]TYC15702.1 PorT family protein [Bizionia gelidisalsuginis]
MGNKKHIDRLFQEKFKDFEAKPSDAVWQNIKKQLNPPKETAKPVVPLWSKWAAIAAIVLVLMTAGINVFTNGTTNTDSPSGEETTRSTTNSSSSTSIGTKETVGNVTDHENQIVDSTNQSTTNTLSNGTKHTPSVTHSTAQELNSSSVENKRNGIYSKGNPPSKASQDAAVANPSSIVGNTKKKDGGKTSTRLNTSATNTPLASTSSSSLSQSKPKSNSQPADKQNATTITANSSKKNSNLYSNPYKKNTLNVKTTEELFNTKETITPLDYTDLKKNKTTDESPIIDSSLGESIEEAIARLKKLDEKERAIPFNKWSITANVAPVYYNSLGTGSSIDEQFVNNSKDGELNMSYGIQVGYALNDKLTLRSGVNTLKLSYDTAGVVVYQSVSTGNPDIKPLRNIDFETTPNGENLSVLSTESFNVQQINSIFNDNFNAALSQRMSYIEVPLELEYALINKRMGLHIIGGMSTFFLSDNQVVTEFDNYKTKIGEANNINDISFSTNLSLGLDYNFSKTFTFNFEPTFKYQINTYSASSGNFKPYIIGVYTGFSYTF